MLLTDLVVAIKHLPTLPLVFGTYPNIILRNGEMNISSYNSPLECIKSLVNSVIGTTGSVIDLDNDDQITTFFLNGICTDERVWAKFWRRKQSEHHRNVRNWQKILTIIKIKIKTTTLFLNEKVFYIFDEYFTDFL
jgi:hypothetical protein